MSVYPPDRRQAHDLEYFAKGGVERRSGRWNRRSPGDRRRLWKDRRVFNDPNYKGPERRSGKDRRRVKDRRGPLIEIDLPKVKEEGTAMKKDRGSVKLELKPESYPFIKVHYKQQGEYENDVLETEVSFPKEFWPNLAKACEEIAHNMGAFSSEKVRAALSLMGQSIMDEIKAEVMRLRNKEAYESLADFVAEIASKTDLDKVRKGQMIHEKARALQLEF